jgi:DNA-binding NtrC family response regulator
MPQLRIYLRDEYRWSYSLLDREIGIGRSHDNHIVLPQPEVSRHQALLRREGQQIVLEDKSGRGTDVNADLVQRTVLRHGDTVRVGAYRLRLEIDDPRAAGADTLTRESTLDIPAGPPVAPPLRCELRVVAGPDAGKLVPLGRERVTIGRGARNSVVLSDPTVSNLHIELEPAASGFSLRDLGSTNGTFVNGQRVQSATAEPGAEIRLGNTRLKLQLQEPTEPAAGAALGRMIGQSAAMNRVFEAVRKAARSDAAVLIEGETGTGKELVAHEIHRLSPRAQGPFITLDCSAIPAELIESELFGHEKGAFTTALAQRRGAFELARGGTVFLDEIGELPLALQPKLLRVLEQRAFRRVGGNEAISSDFRVVAATNRRLEQQVQDGRFRQDLFYRLYVLPIALPPLRERAEDIPLLVRQFLKDKPLSMTPAAIDKLLAHAWPGNVRELRNVIERAVVMLEGNTLGAEHLLFVPAGRQPGVAPPAAAAPEVTAEGSLEEVERQAIERTLRAHHGDKRAAAQRLGIALSTLYDKLRRYHISD